jgi:hypothetical protein
MAALLPTLLAGCFSPINQANDSNVEITVIDVDDFASDPSAYHGIIGIKGVVASTRQSDSSFVIIDVREYELCGVLTCATNEITIRVPADKYSGELPNSEDIVIAYGEFKTSDNYSIIEVSRIERDNQVIIRQNKT